MVNGQTPPEPMLENRSTREEMVRQEIVKAEESKKPPPGTVERILNFQERNLLIDAAIRHCKKEDQGTEKDIKNLRRLKEAIDFEETIKYFDMMDDALEDLVTEWQSAKVIWLAWTQYQAGNFSAELMKKKFPKVDLATTPKRPARNSPVLSGEEMRGKARSFYLPSKVDVWVQDVIKNITWKPEKEEYVNELYGKFDMNESEKG